MKALNPEAIFVGTGSEAVIPRSIPGTEKDFVCTSTEILNGAVKLTGKKVAVVGSGMTGLETAELLASQGNEISVIEMAETIAPGAYFQNVNDVRKRLDPFAVYYTGHKLLEIQDDAGRLEKTDGGEIVTLSADYVVLSLGVKADHSVAQAMEGICPKVYRIGDTRQIGRIQSAVASAYRECYRYH